MQWCMDQGSFLLKYSRQIPLEQLHVFHYLCVLSLALIIVYKKREVDHLFRVDCIVVQSWKIYSSGFFISGFLRNFFQVGYLFFQKFKERQGVEKGEGNFFFLEQSKWTEVGFTYNFKFLIIKEPNYLANPTVINLSIIWAASSPQAIRVIGSMHWIICDKPLKIKWNR